MAYFGGVSNSEQFSYTKWISLLFFNSFIEYLSFTISPFFLGRYLVTTEQLRTKKGMCHGIPISP
jgi:hypothetical protein